jgi:hypothetical protein
MKPNQNLEITPLAQITDSQKVRVFDTLYSMCLSHVKGGRSHIDCDCKHYIYEVAMEGCLGEGIFRRMNE